MILNSQKKSFWWLGENNLIISFYNNWFFRCLRSTIIIGIQFKLMISTKLSAEFKASYGRESSKQKAKCDWGYSKNWQTEKWMQFNNVSQEHTSLIACRKHHCERRGIWQSQILPIQILTVRKVLTLQLLLDCWS